MPITLLDLRGRVRARADMESSAFVTDAVLNGFIRSAASELYDILGQKFGEDYFEKDAAAIPTVIGQEEYSPPADFNRLTRLAIKLNGKWVPVHRYGKDEREQLENCGNVSVGFKYRLRGTKLSLLPTPAMVADLRLTYVPLGPVLNLDGDAIGNFQGWEEYIVVVAAIMCLQKEESDTSQLERELVKLTNRIESAAERRDENAPARIVDVEGRVGADDDLEGFW